LRALLRVAQLEEQGTSTSMVAGSTPAAQANLRAGGPSGESTKLACGSSILPPEATAS
jgi:hypothetical protein